MILNVLLLLIWLPTFTACSNWHIILSGGVFNSCSSSDFLEQSKNQLRNETEVILRSLYPSMSDEKKWIKLSSIDMDNSSHSCPSPWIMVTSPSRLCASSSCDSIVSLSVNAPYSRIRGKVIGNATGLPDGFHQHVSNPSIEMGYLDGVSITHGHPRQHVWSLTTSPYEDYFSQCPCRRTGQGTLPQFVGSHYFCEKPHNGPLWDGQDCNSASCCAFNSPPWFDVTIPVTTSDAIELRICSDEAFWDERIFIKKMIILVQ